MSDCKTCSYYYEEQDTNYADCMLNKDEKYWDSELKCQKYVDISFKGDEE